MTPTLYLYRLRLPTTVRATQRLLGQPYELHRLLWKVFAGSPSPRVLFRIEPVRDSGPLATVLVQSEVPGDWGRAELPTGVSAESKVFSPDLASGTRMRFRLRANPTVKRCLKDRKNGRREGIVGENSQIDWLARKGRVCGFEVKQCWCRDEGMVRMRQGDRSISLLSVLFEGALEILDGQRFAGALREGLGSAKGFGFGLLSVARM